jgi:hypothetical protein
VLDCQVGTPPVLDDGVACTDDSCDEAADVVVNAVNDANCDNGLWCDGFETCDAALDCQSGTAPATDDGVSCTDDSCDEAGDSIVNAPNDSLCDDSNICTDDLCSPLLGCQYLNNALPCDDADACSDGDVCSGGVCTSGGPLDCDDDNGCTADSCDQVLGCGHEPIPDCAAVPATSLWGQLMLGLLLTTTGALSLIYGRRRSRAPVKAKR